MIGYSSYHNTEPNNEFFRVRGFYEYIGTDLMNEIAERTKSGQSFTSVELKTLFVSFINALAFLQSRKMVHGDIRPLYITYNQSGTGSEFKLADRLGDPSSPNQVQLNNMQCGRMLYLSNILYEKLCVYNGGD